MAKEDADKKERVIHTRVSESMDEELKERAAALGVSVSNLVRNVLQNTLGLVEAIVADSASVARSARGEARPIRDAARPPAGDLAKILAWQPALLARNAVCERCNDLLPKGTDAAVGLTDRPGPKPVLCRRCLEELRHDRDPDVA